MAKRKTVVDYDFSKEEIKKRRKFPKLRAIALGCLIAFQLLCVFIAFTYEPKPDDRIDCYEIYVVPKDDGTLDIEYKISWTPLKVGEPLTWIYIGVPNPVYTIIEYSDNIKSIDRYVDGNDMCHMDIDFKEKHRNGDTFEFYVKINQQFMLCEDNGRKFYELVPCWFNRIPVENYRFNWYNNGKIASSNYDYLNNEWLTWEGSMGPGECRLLRVDYTEFNNANTVRYKEFDSDGVWNALESDKFACHAIMGVLILYV